MDRNTVLKTTLSALLCLVSISVMSQFLIFNVCSITEAKLKYFLNFYLRNMTTVVTLVWHWHKVNCNVWLNSLTRWHLCFSQWKISNGQSSFAWLFWYQHFWLFCWLVEFFGEWNAKGSTKHVHFWVQKKATQSLWSIGCVLLSGVESNNAKSNSFHFTFIFYHYFLGTWVCPERIPDILEEPYQTKSQGLFQDLKRKWKIRQNISTT